MRFNQTLPIALLTVLLAACGGSLEGGGGTTDPTPTPEPTGVPTPTPEPDVPPPAEPGVPSSFIYVGASPTWIAIEGTGGAGRQESSIVGFKLIDRNGDPVEGVDVDFSFTGPSGSTIDPETGTTNADGVVSTTVLAGPVSGPVSVNVITADQSIRMQSDLLSISTGVADQNSFSISVAQHAPESMNIDGVTDAVTIRLADKYNNAVPDGTVVYFTTEGGAIRDIPSGTVGSCLTVASECTLNWKSQNPRPEGNELSSDHACAFSTITGIAPCINEGGMGQPYAGRVTITAFSMGEESFTDNDADGWFTPGDTLIKDLPEVFYDHNEDNLYKDNASVGIEDDLEEFYDRDLDQAYSNADGKYNGLLCSAESEGAGDCTRELINVRGDTAIIMASGSQLFRVQQHVGSDAAHAITVYEPLLEVQKTEVKILTDDENYDAAIAKTEMIEAKQAELAASKALDEDPENEALQAALALATKKAENAVEILTAVDLRDFYNEKLTVLYTMVDKGSIDSNYADVVQYPRASFTAYIADKYNNRPPTGSVISFEARNGKVLGKTTYTLPDGNALGPIATSFVVVPNEPLDEVAFDYLYIKVTAPSGLVSSYEIGVLDPVPPPSE